MQSFECSTCGYSTSVKRNFQSHLARRTPCGPKAVSAPSKIDASDLVPVPVPAVPAAEKEPAATAAPTPTPVTEKEPAATAAPAPAATAKSDASTQCDPLPYPGVVINTCREETVQAMYNTINQLQVLIQRPHPDAVIHTQYMWVVVQSLAKIYADMIRSLRIHANVSQALDDVGPEHHVAVAKEAIALMAAAAVVK
jgi:hypothetical protein